MVLTALVCSRTMTGRMLPYSTQLRAIAQSGKMAVVALLVWSQWDACEMRLASLILIPLGLYSLHAHMPFLLVD
jgi:hypothetical protein